MLACSITAHPCMPMYIYAYTTQDDATCFTCAPTTGVLDDILGLAALKFRQLHEIYLLCFYTSINVGLSIFRRLISINVHCIYRRTHRKTFEDDMPNF